MKKSFFRNTLFIITALMLISASAASAHGFRSNYSIPEGLSLEEYQLKDGVYTGTATGFRPGLLVEISVSNGRLSQVEVVDHNEIGRQFYLTPINLIPGDIIAEQSTEVDVVSGATATSKAIMAAVEDAVLKAKI